MAVTRLAAAMLSVERVSHMALVVDPDIDDANRYRGRPHQQRRWQTTTHSEARYSPSPPTDAWHLVEGFKTEIDCNASLADTLDADEESGGEELRRRVFELKEAGPIPSKRKPISRKFYAREFDFFKEYCSKLDKSRTPQQILRECRMEELKGYIDWRSRKFRVKEQSSIETYWKRVAANYKDITGKRLEYGVESELYNFIATLGLKKSKKPKQAMYSHDFQVIQSAHWSYDTRAMHGRVRVSLSLARLLSAATSTRPSALVLGPAAMGENKVLCWGHITLKKMREHEGSASSTIVAQVDLVHVKNEDGAGRTKKFIFALEPSPGLCIVSHLIALAFADNAFRRQYKSISEIFSLQIPQHKEELKLRFKHKSMAQPVLRKVERTPAGLHISEDKAMPYNVYRDQIVWLGKLVGMELQSQLYDIRRGSGRKINQVLTTAESNQTMGHHGDVFQRFYLPELIPADYVSIYFGVPSKGDLIESAARMGLSRDSRAPIGLTEAQKHEVFNHPELVRLRARRQRYTARLRDKGYKPLEAAKGTRLYARYEEIDKELKRAAVRLKREREMQEKRAFHDTIDELEIKNQLDGTELPDFPAREELVEFEFYERQKITQHLSCNPDDLDELQPIHARIQYVELLAQYCSRQESRTFYKQPRADRLTDSEVAKQVSFHKCDLMELDVTRTDTAISEEPLPLRFNELVCVRCTRKDGRSREERMTPFKNKFTLNRHTNIHVEHGEFNEPAECAHESCFELLKNLMHYKAHCYRVHGVEH